MDNNWVDTSINEISEHLNNFGKTSEIEELMMSYMHYPLVKSVCQKWNNFAEDNPTKMRSYNVFEIKIVWFFQKDKFEIEVQKTDGEDKQNIVKSRRLSGRQNFFELIKFLAPRHLYVISHFTSKIKHLLEDIPSWWKLNVENTTFTFKRPNATPRFCSQFVSFTISDFHLLKLTNIYISSDLLPYAKSLVSLQKLDYRGYCEESDEVLDAISTRSKCFKILRVAASFSAETLINFFKNGSFDSVVKVQFDKLSDRSGGKKYLEDFITSTKDYHMETKKDGFITSFLATFMFRDTHFTLTIDDCINRSRSLIH